MEYLIENISPPLLWFIIGIVCFVLEIVLPGFFVFFFGASAWVVACLSLVVTTSFHTQLLIFVALSITTMLLFRARIMRFISPTVPEENAGCPFGEVVEDIIPPACGKIRHSGTYWQATCPVHMRKGQMARVISQENLMLFVEPVDESIAKKEDAK